MMFVCERLLLYFFVAKPSKCRKGCFSFPLIFDSRFRILSKPIQNFFVSLNCICKKHFKDIHNFNTIL